MRRFQLISAIALCLVARCALGQYQTAPAYGNGYQQQRKMAPSPQRYGGQQQSAMSAQSAYSADSANSMDSYGANQQEVGEQAGSSNYGSKSQQSYGAQQQAGRTGSSGYGGSMGGGQSASGYGKQQAAASYGAEPQHPPMPFAFGYDIDDGYGNTQYHKENGDEAGKRTGSYGYRDAYGVFRYVDYVADENGFRATIKTNEPGTANESPADVELTAEEPPANTNPGSKSGYGSSSSSSSYGSSSSSMGGAGSSYGSPSSSMGGAGSSYGSSGSNSAYGSSASAMGATGGSSYGSPSGSSNQQQQYAKGGSTSSMLAAGDMGQSEMGPAGSQYGSASMGGAKSYRSNGSPMRPMGGQQQYGGRQMGAAGYGGMGGMGAMGALMAKASRYGSQTGGGPGQRASSQYANEQQDEQQQQQQQQYGAPEMMMTMGGPPSSYGQQMGPRSMTRMASSPAYSAGQAQMMMPAAMMSSAMMDKAEAEAYGAGAAQQQQMSSAYGGGADSGASAYTSMRLSPMEARQSAATKSYGAAKQNGYMMDGGRKSGAPSMGALVKRY